MVKNYLDAFSDSKHSNCSDDEKLMVGTILVDYLHPMLDDPYVFESNLY